MANEKTESVKMVSNIQIFPFKMGCTGGTNKVAALANVTLFGKFLVRGHIMGKGKKKFNSLKGR